MAEVVIQNAALADAGDIPCLMIEDCFVEPAYRKRGIATRLMREAQAWALRRGVRRVQLQVWAKNEGASRLYRNGWQEE